jgi:hypothetical protein
MNLKRFLGVTTVFATLITSLTPALASDTKFNCVSEITKTAGSMAKGSCIPHGLSINLSYGSEYARLMSKAITASYMNDYDTAIIHFKKAQTISGSSDSEVARGLLGATMAKHIKNNPDKRHTSYQVWLLVTGEYSIYDNHSDDSGLASRLLNPQP